MSLHTKLSPEVEKKLRNQKRNSTISAVIIALLAFALIVAILFYIALSPLFKNQEELVTYSSAAETDEPITKPEMTDQVEKKPSSPASSLSKVIAATTPSATSIPVPDVTIVEPSLDFGDGNDFGDGWGAEGSGSGGGGGGGSFFGRKTSNKLGVILDTSKSTARTILTVIKELEDNFSSAAIVCVEEARIGGLGSQKSHPFQDVKAHKYIPSLIKNLPAIESLSKFPVCYIPEPANNGRRASLSVAIELLLEKDLADEIYIFSDFADGPHDPALMEELTQKMLKKEIKLHMLTVTKAKNPNIEAFLPLSTKTNGTFTFFHELVGEKDGKKKKDKKKKKN